MIKEGDIVVCVDVSTTMGLRVAPLVKNSEYLINEITRCSCGKVFVDVGFKRPDQFACNWRCSGCGKPSNPLVWWCNINRFRKRDEINASLESEIQECLTKELQSL